MKLVEFVYKKADGTLSNRAVVELAQPTHHFEGIDVSQLDETEFASFIGEFRELKNLQHQQMQELLVKHDLKHNYRRFIPAQMTHVAAEHI